MKHFAHKKGNTSFVYLASQVIMSEIHYTECQIQYMVNTCMAHKMCIGNNKEGVNTFEPFNLGFGLRTLPKLIFLAFDNNKFSTSII